MKNTVEDLAVRDLIPDDKELIKLIEDAGIESNSFLTVVNFAKPCYEYVGPTCQTITGYPDEAFLSGGPEFVFSKLTKETALESVHTLIAFSQQAKEPGYDLRTVRIMEFTGVINTGFGYTKKLAILGLPLTYTTNNEMKLGITLHAEVDDEMISLCKQRLVAIKERHNLVYQHPSVATNDEPLQKLYIQKRPEQSLTTREEEVLKLMAKGFTSSEIAAKLSIAENTVESHRKNIFQKLNAKNMAELIKKASKLYWLE